MSSFFLSNWSPPDDPARPLPAEGRPWPSEDNDGDYDANDDKDGDDDEKDDHAIGYSNQLEHNNVTFHSFKG